MHRRDRPSPRRYGGVIVLELSADERIEPSTDRVADVLAAGRDDHDFILRRDVRHAGYTFGFFGHQRTPFSY